MALDDQLAALAAGELDDDTARALRARVADDPALARRLARHEQLQRLLTDWEAPAMSEQGVRRLESRVEEALAALGEEPLADRPTPSAAPTATGEPTEHTSEHTPVVDMASARRRRDEQATGGSVVAWPSWGAGAAVAAVLAAVVGTGIVLGGLPGGADLDMLADGDSAEESTDDSAEVAQLESDDGAADSATTESADEGAAGATGLTSEETARLGPAQRAGVDVAEGDLLALVELADEADAPQSAPADEDAEATDDSGQDTTADASAADPAEQCVQEALRRDTAPADDRRVWLLADGTYADQDAVFVVVRTPQDGAEDRYEVLAYDPGDCSLLARDDTSR